MTKLSGTVKSANVKTTHAGRHILKMEIITGYLKKHVEKAQLLLGHLDPFLPNLLVGRKVCIQGDQRSDGLFVRRLQVAK